MPFELFVDRLPFARPDGEAPLFRNHWRPWLPIVAKNSDWQGPFPDDVYPVPWLFDSGHDGDATTWASHLVHGCGIAVADLIDTRHFHPYWRSLTTSTNTRNMALARKANLWLFSNLERFRDKPLRIPMNDNLILMDSAEPAPPDFHDQFPIPAALDIEPSSAPGLVSLIGMRAMIAASLKVEIDLVAKTISVFRWTKMPFRFRGRRIDINWYPLYTASK